MESVIVRALGGLVASYVFLYFLLHWTQDAREPPSIVNGVPFISPLVRMIREKSKFYLRLRDSYKQLPIYTLRLPFVRIYIVNATELIPVLQKEWRTVSFAAIAAAAGSAVGMSKKALKIMQDDITEDHGFSVSWPRFIMPAMSAGQDLDEMNRVAITVFAAQTEKLKANGRGAVTVVSLRDWSREAMVTATTEAVWGPENPYRDPEVAEAWKTFESGFLTISMFPFAKYIFPHLYRARERVAAAMLEYIRRGGYKTASGLVRKRWEHHREQFGLEDEDIARGELGNTFAVLGNSTPCAFWVLYHIFSDRTVLEDIRQELLAQVVTVKQKETTSSHDEKNENEEIVFSIDLAEIRTTCPVLLSTFQETLRYRAVNPGPRVIVEDVHLRLDDGHRHILLKKGSMLMIPAPVQHTSVSAWGVDAGEFDHMRFFTPRTTTGQKNNKKGPNRVAFRAFGGGHALCPGRHFATAEIMALAALMVLQFDVVPVAGSWVEPTCDNSPSQAAFPIPDEDIMVELQPRNPGARWRVTYSGSSEVVGIVSEDIE